MTLASKIFCFSFSFTKELETAKATNRLEIRHLSMVELIAWNSITGCLFLINPFEIKVSRLSYLVRNGHGHHGALVNNESMVKQFSRRSCVSNLPWENLESQQDI